MKCPNVRVVFDRKKRAAKSGKGKLEVVINFDRLSHKYILMGEATPDTWETFAQSSNVIEKIEECEKILEGLKVVNKEVKIDDFNQVYEDKHKAEFIKKNKNMYNGYYQNASFLNYMKDAIMAESSREGTRKHKLVVLEALRKFGKIRRFCDLTPANIMDFDQMLRQDGIRSDYTIHHNYHKKVHQYTHQLKMKGMIPEDPYDRIDRIPVGRNKEREPLTEKELVKVREAKLDPKYIPIRDLFIFMAYTGLSFGDSQLFDFDRCTDEVEGLYYIDGKRIKNGNKYFTPILPPAMDVLKKYHFKLPHIDNHTANQYLHVIQMLLHINKSMTTHIARHSFATLILSHDVPITSLSRMLGHREIRTTQIYAKILRNSIERSGNKVAGELL